jgi:hypothetical protein
MQGQLQGQGQRRRTELALSLPKGVCNPHERWQGGRGVRRSTRRGGNLGSTLTNSQSGFYRGGIRDITAPEQQKWAIRLPEAYSGGVGLVGRE